MTSILPARGVRVTILVDEDRTELEALLERGGMESIYLSCLVHEFGVAPSDALGHGRFYGFWRGSRLDAAVFAGNARNMTSVGSAEDVESLLPRVARGPHRPRLFVGPSGHAQPVRRSLFRGGLRPRLDRKQGYYILEKGAVADLDPLELRPARPEETVDVVRAHAAMIEEDLNIPSLHLDHEKLGDLSRARIRAGKIWVHVKDGNLVFKTEEIARSKNAVLVGGVYTAPEYRGRGIAARGMATWAHTLLDRGGLERFALHVNAVNTPAYRAYERCGYRRVSTLRLILTY